MDHKAINNNSDNNDTNNIDNERKPKMNDELFESSMETYKDGLGFIGIDSTAVHEVSIVVDDHADFLGEDDVSQEIDDILDSPDTEDDDERDAQVQKALKLLAQLQKAVNRKWNSVIEIRTYWNIQIGRLLDFLKKKIGHGEWAVWACENLAFLPARTRQTYMQVGVISGVEPWAFLGTDELAHLAQYVAKDGDDPIGDFVEKHGIAFDKESRETIKEFKLKINTVVGKERLEKHGVTLEPDLIRSWLAQGHEIKRELINDLKMVQECKGDPNLALRHRLTNQGKSSKELEPRKAILSVKAAAASFRSVVANLRNSSDLLQKADAADLEAINVILRELANMLIAAPLVGDTANAE